MSDNVDGHYHNGDLMMIMAFGPKWYNVKGNNRIFLEAGEAKTANRLPSCAGILTSNYMYFVTYTKLIWLL